MLVMWAAVLATCASTSAALEYHVSALNGCDSQPGTIGQPFQTIQRCVDELVVATYEEVVGETCAGGVSLVPMQSEDLELCADHCRLSGNCEYFVIEASGSGFLCRAAACGASSGLKKYRAKPSHEWAPEPRTCIVGEGSYFESLRIHHVKGSAESPVAIRAAPNSNVSLHATIEVNGWTEHMRVPSPSGGEATIWESAPLSTVVWQLWMQPPGQNHKTPQAQRRFEMMTPARWPNARFSDRTVFYRNFWGKQRESVETGCTHDCSEHGCRQALGYASAAQCTSAEALRGMLVDDGSGWRNLSTARWNGKPLDATGAIAVMNSGSWLTFQQEVAHHVPGSNRFSYTSDFRLVKFRTNGYFLEGKKEFLDGPEEWWIDTSTRKVYLITDDGQSPSATSRQVRGKANDYCITISHASHLTIHGLHIFGCAIKSEPAYPYFAGPLTISSNELFFPTVTKRALGQLTVDRSPSMSWLYTWGRSNSDEQLPLTIYNNTWFGAEGTALNYRGRATVDNNLFLNNDWTGVEGRDGVIGMAVVVGTGVAGTTVFTHNSLLYNGPSVTFNVDSAGALIYGNIVAGQGFGMIQNDGAHIQTKPNMQHNTRIENNWGFDSPKGSFRFDDAALCFTNSPDCIGHFGTMKNNVDVGTRGIMVKGNNHNVLNNLAINSELRVFDKFMKNDCPARCMNTLTTVRGNVGTALNIQRSVEILNDPNGADTYNTNVGSTQLNQMMPGYKFKDFRPLVGTLIAGLGPYSARDPDAPISSNYFIPGKRTHHASHPIPSNGSVASYKVTDVMFRPALSAMRHHVYLGCRKEAVALAGIDSSCDDEIRVVKSVLEAPLNTLPIGNSIVGLCQTFYWRVDAELKDGTVVPGELWEFGLQSSDSVSAAQRVTPVDEAIVSLQWGRDNARPMGNDRFFTSESVWLGGRPGNIPKSVEGVHFDYMVKFNLKKLQGARVRKATLTMTKLAATLSDELQPEYDLGDEDDHISAWAVPQSLSWWTQSNLTRRWVEETMQATQRSLGTRQNIGLAGNASFDVTSDVTDLGGRVIQGACSFRFSTATRRRRGNPAHFNTIYTTMNNRMIPPQLLLEFELPGAPELTVTDISPLSDSDPREVALSWPLVAGAPSKSFVVTKTISPLESARITARQGAAHPFGGGSASKPAGLRSCNYAFAKNKPYEWFIKFDVSELRGQDLQSVSLSVSKCKSSQECVDGCKKEKKCICNGGGRGCGGGDIDTPYDAASDDLHLWHVANGWDSGYHYLEYSKSWTVTWNVCDQQTLLTGEGALQFSTYLGSVSSVGERGTAAFSVTDVVRRAANDGDGILSFRFTVTGTAQRFFIAQGAAGGPTLTATVKTVIQADITQYEAQLQSWDGHGIQPSSPFVPLYFGAAGSVNAQVPHENSALVRVRTRTQADMPDAAVINGPWSYATLFKTDGLCLTSTMTASSTPTATMSTSTSTVAITMSTSSTSTAKTTTTMTTTASQTATTTKSSTLRKTEAPSPMPSRPLPSPSPPAAVQVTTFDTEMEFADDADVEQLELDKLKAAMAAASGVNAENIEIRNVEYRTKVAYSMTETVSKAAARTAVAKACNVSESQVEVHVASRRLSASRRFATTIEATIKTRTASEVASIATKAADSALLKQAFADGGLTVEPTIAVQPENAVVVSTTLKGEAGAAAPAVPSANTIQTQVSDKVGINVVASTSSVENAILVLSSTTRPEELSEDDETDKGVLRLIGLFSSVLSLCSVV